MKLLARVLIVLVALSLVAHAADAGVEVAAHAGTSVVQSNSNAGDEAPTAAVAHVCHVSAHVPALVGAMIPAEEVRAAKPVAFYRLRLTSVETPPVTPPPIA